MRIRKGKERAVVKLKFESLERFWEIKLAFDSGFLLPNLKICCDTPCLKIPLKY